MASWAVGDEDPLQEEDAEPKVPKVHPQAAIDPRRRIWKDVPEDATHAFDTNRLPHIVRYPYDEPVIWHPYSEPLRRDAHQPRRQLKYATTPYNGTIGGMALCSYTLFYGGMGAAVYGSIRGWFAVPRYTGWRVRLNSALNLSTRLISRTLPQFGAAAFILGSSMTFFQSARGRYNDHWTPPLFGLYAGLAIGVLTMPNGAKIVRKRNGALRVPSVAAFPLLCALGGFVALSPSLLKHRWEHDYSRRYKAPPNELELYPHLADAYTHAAGARRMYTDRFWERESRMGWRERWTRFWNSYDVYLPDAAPERSQHVPGTAVPFRYAPDLPKSAPVPELPLGVEPAPLVERMQKLPEKHREY